MRKLSVGQRKALSEFFTSGAVAWLSAGVIAPFFVGKTSQNIAGSLIWGTLFTGSFIIISLNLTKEVKS